MSAASYIAPDGLMLARRYSEDEGYPLYFLQGTAKHRDATWARQSVIWRIARDTLLSLPEIAAVMKKDHTSILHAIRAENERRGANVRGMQFPSDYHRRHRLTALLHAELSREVRP